MGLDDIVVVGKVVAPAAMCSVAKDEKSSIQRHRKRSRARIISIMWIGGVGESYVSIVPQLQSCKFRSFRNIIIIGKRCSLQIYVLAP